MLDVFPKLSDHGHKIMMLQWLNIKLYNMHCDNIVRTIQKKETETKSKK